MADNERLPDSSLGGMPDIPPEVIDAFRKSPPNSEISTNETKKRWADLIAALNVRAEQMRLTAEQKRGFVLGVVSVLELVGFQEVYEREIRPLNQLLELTSPPEDPPISA